MSSSDSLRRVANSVRLCSAASSSWEDVPVAIMGAVVCRGGTGAKLPMRPDPLGSISAGGSVNGMLAGQPLKGSTPPMAPVVCGTVGIETAGRPLKGSTPPDSPGVL
jgi:hypothetical protein